MRIGPSGAGDVGGGLRLGRGSEGLMGEGMADDGSAMDEVFLDDHFEDVRGAAPVPGALGIDDGDGSLGADLEAIGLGACDERRGADEAELLETAL